MADLVYKDDRRVMLRIRLDRAIFDALEKAYGTQGLALRALREELPQSLMWLLRNAPNADSHEVRSVTAAGAPKASRLDS